MNLLLAAVFLLQDKTAEETFKKIEEAVHSAKTVTIKFKCEAFKTGEKEPGVVAEGTVLAKEGNKVFAVESILLEGKKTHKKQISDGDKQAFWVNDDRTDKDLPKYERTKVLNGLLRVGYLQAQLLKYNVISLEPGAKPDDLDPRELLLLKDFAFGPEDSGAKTITHKFKDYEGVTGKVWYEPKRLRLLKRRVDFDGGYEIEAYDEFTLNADIPDDKFKLRDK